MAEIRGQRNKLATIDGTIHPTAMAEFLTNRASEIKAAVLVADLADGTTKALYYRTTNAEVAWFIVALQSGLFSALTTERD